MPTINVYPTTGTIKVFTQEGPPGPMGPPGPGAGASANPNNKATLGTDSLILVQGTAVGIAATTHAQTVSGDDPQLTNARTPLPHKATHLVGGSDPIALVTTATAGLCVPPDGTTIQITGGKLVAVGGGGGGGDMYKSVYDTNNTGIVDNAEALLGHVPPASGNATAGQVVLGTDTRLSDARTPGAHAASHLDNGTDVIPVVTTTRTGLVPKLSGAATTFLNGTGSFSTPAGGGGGDMTKAVYDINNDGIVDQAAAVPWTGVTGKPASFAPSAHATSHESGGSDPIPIDTLAAPTDVTTLNATLTAHGLLPKLGGGTGNFLRADGVWASPPAGGGGGDMLKSVYDTNNDSIVDHAALSDTAPWTGITGKPASFPPSTHGSTHAGGGTDPVPIATTTVAGLVPAKPNAGVNATTTQVVMGDDTRLSDARSPSAHQASHVSGTDQIPLPTTTVKGLCPPLDGNAAHFLSGAGTCLIPPAAAPAPHAITHEIGGSDAIPIDLLGSATDNTNLNASTSAHGLMPKANGSANSFYGSDATQKLVTYAMLGGSQPGPVAHQASHVSGADQIPSASATARGLLGQLSGATTDYVGGDNACHALPAVPAASSTTPAMDGPAAIGVGTTYARADHVHPNDTSRVAATRAILTTQSITGGGDLSADRTLTLVGDVASPGNSMVYGTSSSGVRGWQAASAGGGASPMNIQTFNVGSGQTWTKPSGSPTLVKVYAFGSGGGAGSGAVCLNVPNDHAGGGGGGGGGCSIADFLPSQLPATVTVNVGAGGNGGTAVSGTTNLLGNNGSAGGATSFGTYLSAGGGNGGIGGNQTGFSTPAAGGTGLNIGGAGGLQANYNTQAATAGAQGTQYGSSGGGGGGNYYSAPGLGGNMTLTGTGGGTVTTSGGSPVAGGIGGNASGLYGAAGGGGGYYPLSTGVANGANGGAGGSYGGGAGGGSAAVTTGSSQTSGAGGKGGDGYMVVLTYF